MAQSSTPANWSEISLTFQKIEITSVLGGTTATDDWLAANDSNLLPRRAARNTVVPVRLPHR